MENNEMELEQEQELQEQLPQQTEPVARPMWQRVLAWIALAVFLGFLFMYYVNILRSGA